MSGPHSPTEYPQNRVAGWLMAAHHVARLKGFLHVVAATLSERAVFKAGVAAVAVSLAPAFTHEAHNYGNKENAGADVGRLSPYRCALRVVRDRRDFEGPDLRR